MKQMIKIFTALFLALITMPGFSAYNMNALKRQLAKTNSIAALQSAYLDAVNTILNDKQYNNVNDDIKKGAYNKAAKAAGVSAPSYSSNSPTTTGSSNASVEEITVTGKIIDKDNNGPIGRAALISVKNYDRSPDISDNDGNFTLRNIPNDARISVECGGYKSQELVVAKNMEIILEKDNNTNLNEVEIKAPDQNCTEEEKKQSNIAVGKRNDKGKCIPSECIDGYKLNTITKKCVLDKKKDAPTTTTAPDPKQPCALIDNSVYVQHDEQGKCTKVTCESAYTYNAEQGKCVPKDTRTDEEKAKALEEAQAKYDEAKETEQSKANRTLTALTTAATGIGGMELAQGLAEQKADKDAEQDMNAYIATMRCEYGKGKSVKAGSEPIELPGGNNNDLMKYRNEYFALAADLKTRKEALDMKPGIESEEILDKADLGLYDDESTGITDGTYASLYRAQMLGSTTDQEQIDADKKTSKNRVIGGAVAAGVGVVGGVLGDSLINGELGEKLKEAIKNNKAGTETKALLKKEAKALDDLKKCLKQAGVKETEKLTFKEFYPSVLSVSGINCKKDLIIGDDDDIRATDIFIDSIDADEMVTKMREHIYDKTIAIMVGYNRFDSNAENLAQEVHNIEKKLENSIESVQEKFKEAEEKDKESAKKFNINLGDFTGSSNGLGLSSITSIFNGSGLSADGPSNFDLSSFLRK